MINTWPQDEPRFGYCGDCINKGHCRECYRGSYYERHNEDTDY